MKTLLDDEFNILIVEDDAGHAELLTIQLRDWKIVSPITYSDNGRDAIKEVNWHITHSQKPLLILLDLNLPQTSGIEVLEHINSLQKYNIMVIILTSTARPEEIERCYELGYTVMLKKPVQHLEFIESIFQVITGSNSAHSIAS